MLDNTVRLMEASVLIVETRLWWGNEGTGRECKGESGIPRENFKLKEFSESKELGELRALEAESFAEEVIGVVVVGEGETDGEGRREEGADLGCAVDKCIDGVIREGKRGGGGNRTASAGRESTVAEIGGKKVAELSAERAKAEAATAGDGSCVERVAWAAARRWGGRYTALGTETLGMAEADSNGSTAGAATLKLSGTLQGWRATGRAAGTQPDDTSGVAEVEITALRVTPVEMDEVVGEESRERGVGWFWLAKDPNMGESVESVNPQKSNPVLRLLWCGERKEEAPVNTGDALRNTCGGFLLALSITTW